MTTQQIAEVCHEANRAYCHTIGDDTQAHWDNIDQQERNSKVRGVEFAIENPDVPPSAQHEAWLADKERGGWKHGPVKDQMLKQHPCMVPYAELPVEQRIKDSLFRAVVKGLCVKEK